MLDQSGQPPGQREMLARGVTNKWLPFILRLGCTTLLLAILFKSFNWSMLLKTLARVDGAILLTGLIVGIFGVILSSYQWKCLLEGEQIKIDLAKLINFYFIGIAFNHFLPTSMGGDVIKAYYVSREYASHVVSASAVLMSRATGLFGMFVVAMSALVIWHTSFPGGIVSSFLFLFLFSCTAILLIVVSISLLFRIARGKWAKQPVVAAALNVGNALSASARRPLSMSSAILFGILFHVELCLNYYIYAVSLHMDVPFSFYLIAIPFVSLVASLPISINGFGLRESVFVYVFSLIHVPVSLSLLLAFLVDLQTLLFGVIGGGIYLAMGRRKREASDVDRSRYVALQAGWNEEIP